MKTTGITIDRTGKVDMYFFKNERRNEGLAQFAKKSKQVVDKGGISLMLGSISDEAVAQAVIFLKNLPA